MKKWVLLIVLTLAFILRVVILDKYPVGFTPDEASFGYDAYSLLKTGKDQWGNSWPLVLKSFGDYKAPLYAYLSMPSVAAFGLTKFAVRLPNALLGVGAVYIVYLLSQQLTKNKQLSIIASLLLAISPWHIMMSRGAFEANLITFFVPFGIYLFLKEKYNWSAVIFGLSMFTYHSAKVIAPLIFVALFIFYKKKLIKPLIIFVLFLGLTFYTFTLGAGARVKDVNIFSGSIEAGSELKTAATQGGEPYLSAKLFNNKFTVSFDRFINNYVSYYSPQFLLTKGPAETTYGMMPGTGVLNAIEFLGLIVGLGYIYFSKSPIAKSNPLLGYKELLLFWFLISAVPASLATGPGAVAMVPVVQIISAAGIYYLMQYKKYVSYLLLAFGILSFGVFLERYMFLSPQKSANGMLEGNLAMVEEYIVLSKDSDEVIVPRTLSEPHIYVAFVQKTDPNFYQEQTKLWKFEELAVEWVDQIPEYKLGKFTFKNVE